MEILSSHSDDSIRLQDAIEGAVYRWGAVLVIVAYESPGRKQMIGLKGGETWSSLGSSARVTPAPDYVVCHKSRVKDERWK